MYYTYIISQILYLYLKVNEIWSLVSETPPTCFFSPDLFSFKKKTRLHISASCPHLHVIFVPTHRKSAFLLFCYFLKQDLNFNRLIAFAMFFYYPKHYYICNYEHQCTITCIQVEIHVMIYMDMTQFIICDHKIIYIRAPTLDTPAAD